MPFNRLIRFVDGKGRIAFGDVDKPFAAKDIIGAEVEILVGTFQYGFTRTSEKRRVKQVKWIYQSVLYETNTCSYSIPCQMHPRCYASDLTTGCTPTRPA